MYWLLLPVAAVTLILGLRTPSMLAMLAWLAATAVLLGLWVWFRFREVFPEQNSTEIMLTPMDAEALRQMRAHAEAERANARGQSTGVPNPFPSHSTAHAAATHADYGAQAPFNAPDPFATRPASQAPLPPSGSEARGTLPSAQSAAVPSSSIFSNASRAKFDIDDDPPA